MTLLLAAVHGFPAKPLPIHNIFNSVASKRLSDDTIMLYVAGGSNYEGRPYATFEVAKVYDKTTGIQEHTVQKLMIYPNPANDLITIEQSENEINTNIDILNIYGQLIESIQLSGKTTLNVSGYAKGVYLIRMRKTGAATTFVKQ